MATFTKFTPFVTALGTETHLLSSDSLKLALTNSAPSASNSVLANITEISYTNCSSRVITTSSWSAGKLILADLTLTASGTVGPFRYAVIYNDTAPNDELIAYYDYGSSITLAASDQFVVDFDGTNGLFTIA